MLATYLVLLALNANRLVANQMSEEPFAEVTFMIC